jgi:hypothetical protein
VTSPKLRTGPLAALVVLVLLAAAEWVYVYEVESDFEIAEDVPHVPGVSWRFGEQLLVVWVPRDVAPGIILFTNETTPIPLYDRKYFLLVAPADAQPSQSARAEALLKTPDGVYPVVFRKPDAGIIDILTHSIEDALTILKQIGLQPEYRGKAKLIAKRDHDAGREAAAPTLPIRPSINSTFDVYGGLYFRETPITRTGLVIIPVHGTESACINVPYAAYVGYDAKSFTLGTLIRGGAVDADLIVEVYKMQLGSNCTFLGSQRFRLANNTRYWVSLINSTTSVDQLAVFIMLDVRSFSGQPRVGINASLIYTRTYRYGFEVGEFAARAISASGYQINNYMRRVVIGPYVAYDGYVAQTASSSLTLRIATQPEDGTCKYLRVRFTINGRSSSGTYVYHGRHLGLCIYDVYLPNIWEPSFQTEYFYAKAFGGGLAWVLDIEYTDGSTPYVRSIFLRNADAFRYWRWAEQWKTTPGAVDGIWAFPFLSSAFELYAAPTEPSPAPGVYHGLVTVRVNYVSHYFRVILAISGRFLYPGSDRAVYMKKAEIDIAMPLSVQTLDAVGYYLMPDYQLSPIALPERVKRALRVKKTVDCILTLAGVVGRVAGLLGLATGEGLKSAGDSVKVQMLDYYTARITYRRGWYTNVASDTIIVPLIIPSLYWMDSPTELEITRICLDGNCANLSLKAYVQPDLVNWILSTEFLKNWMCRGQVISTATCEISMR